MKNSQLQISRREVNMVSVSVKSKSTIMAVDDSLIMQNLIKRALEDEYRVVVADNAVDALSLIYQEPVSVLLLDVTMPGIDGLELCRTIRNLPQFQKLPVVMLTARDGSFDKVQGRLAGATEYITKPFNNEQLCQVVKKFIEAQKMSQP